MDSPLYDDIWTRKGISLLWGAEQLARVCKPQQVVSLRAFLQLHVAGWPQDKLALANDRALVVAGLEGCIDALPPSEAEEWLEKIVYAAIVSFQQEVSYAALIFWLADHKRIEHRTSEDAYYWHCGTEYRGQQVALSRCLFNGAQNDLRQILVVEKKTEHWIGLFHPRIS